MVGVSNIKLLNIMTKVNFKKFRMFLDITGERTKLFDIRREVADSIYTEMSGIVAHDLALRIYRSEGEIELNEEEINLLTEFSKRCSGAFADSWEAATKEEYAEGKIARLDEDEPDDVDAEYITQEEFNASFNIGDEITTDDGEKMRCIAIENGVPQWTMVENAKENMEP